MITIYWPGKKVPSWLEKIETTKPETMKAEHNGYGIIIKYKGWFNAFSVSGGFIRIKDGGTVSIFGQGKGVFWGTSIKHYIRHMIRLSKNEN